MITLFRTSYPPVEYKASSMSCAFIFRFLCFLISYIAPIVIAVVITIQDSSTKTDSETPVVVPGKILYFFFIDPQGRGLVYPPQLPEDAFAVTLQTEPALTNDLVTNWTVRVNVSGWEHSIVRAVTVVFQYTVYLQKWATNRIEAIGSYSQTFPIGASHVSAVGDLLFEQGEIVDFRGSFANTSLEIPEMIDPTELLKRQDELSTLFYVDWEDPTVHFGLWHCFTLQLRIRVKPIEIIHSIPLVASLESMIILILSLMYLTTTVMNAFQGFVFRNGILQTWAIPLYKPTSGAKSD
jgi:hypothetical protein